MSNHSKPCPRCGNLAKKIKSAFPWESRCPLYCAPASPRASAVSIVRCWLLGREQANPNGVPLHVLWQ